MLCTDRVNSMHLDETIKVKGCLASIPKKLHKVTKVRTKSKTLASAKKHRRSAVCVVSPRQICQEDKENNAPDEKGNQRQDQKLEKQALTSFVDRDQIKGKYQFLLSAECSLFQKCKNHHQEDNDI